MQHANGFDREIACLVEAALSLACTVQRHRHDEQLRGCCFINLRRHLRYGGGKACAKFAREGRNPLKLKGVDGAAQGAVVFAKTDCAEECG